MQSKGHVSRFSKMGAGLILPSTRLCEQFWPGLP